MPANYLEKATIQEEFDFLDDEESNTKFYEELVNKQGIRIEPLVKMTPIITYSLWRYPLEGENFMVVMRCDYTKQVVYFIKCKVWEDLCLSNKPVTQVLLWRTRDIVYMNATHRLASKVFFDYLLPKYHLIASDSYQTVFGRYFWLSQISEALTIGHKVYRYDRISGDKKRISSFNDVRCNKYDLWGDEDEYANVLVLIGEG